MMFRRLEPPPKVPAPRDQLLQHDGISMTVQSKRPFPERTVRLLITLMGSIGTLLCMYGFFDFPLEIRSLLIVTVVLTCSMRLIRTFAPRIGFGLILVGFAAIPALLLRHREAAVIGAGAIYNIMRRKVLWQAYFPDPSVHVGDWNEAKCVQFVFLLLMIALVCLLEYSDVLMTHSRLLDPVSGDISVFGKRTLFWSGNLQLCCFHADLFLDRHNCGGAKKSFRQIARRTGSFRFYTVFLPR